MTNPKHAETGRSITVESSTSRFWEAEPNPAERRKLIATLFEHIWQKDGSIVAVKPQAAFARYFVAANDARTKHPKQAGKAG